ncbi:hypothetical protein, partial [Shewanella algae]|uniref:hypothetical protein n=1 Tax=Shewanella algae TaxID=38313 RepID=UPI0031F4B96C
AILCQTARLESKTHAAPLMTHLRCPYCPCPFAVLLLLRLVAQDCYLSYCLACLSPDLLLGLLAVAECRFALGLNAIDSNVCLAELHQKPLACSLALNQLFTLSVDVPARKHPNGKQPPQGGG